MTSAASRAAVARTLREADLTTEGQLDGAALDRIADVARGGDVEAVAEQLDAERVGLAKDPKVVQAAREVVEAVRGAQS